MIAENLSLINTYAKTKPSMDFYAKYVEFSELENVLALQQYIYDRIPNKEIFVRDTMDDFIEAFENQGRIFGIYTNEGRLIAYRFITVPGESPKNMGNDLYLPRSEFHKVVHLETTVVHPDFRGRGMQRLTLDYATKWAAAHGFRYLFCTVSPYNPVSLNNIMSGGLKVKDLKLKYGNDEHPGYLRYVLFRDLSISCAECWPDFTMLPILDIEGQQKMLEKGFTGHHFLKTSQSIAYAKCSC